MRVDRRRTVLAFLTASLMCVLGEARAQVTPAYQFRNVFTVSEGTVLDFDGTRALTLHDGKLTMWSNLTTPVVLFEPTERLTTHSALLYEGGVFFTLRQSQPGASGPDADYDIAYRESLLWNGALKPFDAKEAKVARNRRWLAYVRVETADVREALSLKDAVTGEDVWQTVTTFESRMAEQYLVREYDVANNGDLAWSAYVRMPGEQSPSLKYFWRHGGEVVELGGVAERGFVNLETDGHRIAAGLAGDGSIWDGVFFASDQSGWKSVCPVGQSPSETFMNCGAHALGDGWFVFGVNRMNPAGVIEKLTVFKTSISPTFVNLRGEAIVWCDNRRYLVRAEPDRAIEISPAERGKPLTVPAGRVLYIDAWYELFGPSVYRFVLPGDADWAPNGPNKIVFSAGMPPPALLDAGTAEPTDAGAPYESDISQPTTDAGVQLPSAMDASVTQGGQPHAASDDSGCSVRTRIRDHVPQSAWLLLVFGWLIARRRRSCA